MRDRAWARWLAAMALSVLAGCAENSMVLKGQIDKSRADQLAASRAKDELQNRATRMDRDNQELINQLTQAKQQSKVQEDRIIVLRDQLAASNAQLAQLRDDKKNSEQKVQTLTASLQRQGGAPITPNNSLLQTMPSINLPDVVARRDGDVIRVELPAHRLFEPGGARLLPGTPAVILGVMGELLRTYPNQIIGVEGHTDSDPVASTQWRNNHQLSLARATSVYDVLVYQGQINPAQLIVVGHGGNAPVLSNSTPTGKKRNARVELVVYPSTVPGR
jgi:flagellar motor protein MotB